MAFSVKKGSRTLKTYPHIDQCAVWCFLHGYVVRSYKYGACLVDGITIEKITDAQIEEYERVIEDVSNTKNRSKDVE